MIIVLYRFYPPPLLFYNLDVFMKRRFLLYITIEKSKNLQKLYKYILKFVYGGK